MADLVAKVFVGFVMAMLWLSIAGALLFAAYCLWGTTKDMAIALFGKKSEDRNPPESD